MPKEWQVRHFAENDLRAIRPAAHQAKIATRIYSGAKSTRLTGGFGSSGNTSADAELAYSLTMLRARSRQLMRDAPYAKRARLIVINNVIGSGVGLQAQVKNTRGELHKQINDAIEEAWCEWCCADSCHTGGALHFSDFERACLSEVFVAGEVFIRKHPRRFGESEIPLALELIEAERLADEHAVPLPGVSTANVRMGIERDEYGRALAYWIRDQHPGELRSTPNQSIKFTRVPADQIIHLRLIDRWPQTRGEPWLHSVLRKLNDMEEYTASELTAARMSANYFATIESPDQDPLPGEKQDDGSKQLNIEPGTIDQLQPGDELKFHAPNRPNTALDPFLRYMLREVAAGVGCSYESVSRDYSQSNYSSSRLALLDDRDLWKVLQQWWVRSFRNELHEAWLQQAVLARVIPAISVESYALDPERYEAVRWKLRGWSWVDPTKEVSAYNDAIAGNLTTVTDVIEQTGNGQDIEDYIEKRKNELALFAAAGIEHGALAKPATPAAVDPAAEDPAMDNTGDAPKPGRVVSIAKVNHA